MYIIPYGIYISTINYFDMREIASAESKQFIKEHYDVCGYYYLELFLW